MGKGSEMSLTHIQNGKREINTPEFNLWSEANQPTFPEVLEKINKECGSETNVVTKSSHPFREEFSCSLHGVEVNIVKTEPSVQILRIKTHMKTGWTTELEWTHHQKNEGSYLDYFEWYLNKLREVWVIENEKYLKELEDLEESLKS
jgi:hypothetical protein